MRKLIYAINLTMDGCCDHTKGFAEEGLTDHYAQLIRDGLLVYGRKTYQLMFPYWPEAAKDPTSTRAEVEFARAIESAHKVIFSRTLDRVEDGNTTIVRTDLREEILKLKQEAGKDILTGGVDIPSQLTELGLVDEYQVVVLPAIAGEGRRLFDRVKMPETMRLKLVESKVFESGCVALRYSKQ